MPLPRSSVEGESELSESLDDSARREKPSANRGQALAVAIAFAFGSVVMLGWLVSDRGEDPADGATPAGASETRSAASSAGGDGGDGGIPTDAATVEVAGLKGKSASRILAKATSSKIEAALSDGKGWTGGPLRVEAESFSRVVVGKVDRNKGETAPSEKMQSTSLRPRSRSGTRARATFPSTTSISSSSIPSAALSARRRATRAWTRA